ncbi:hypothetical protein T492DRAFT_1021972 [Pavlovales sp. CCMP2436]|nr:hypothetical protein T492DRAFT_1021972 [Pavlovales sp. CCMP2436]
MLTTATCLEHLKANRTENLVPSGKIPDQRNFDILPAIGFPRTANPNFTVPILQLPSALLPGRFANEEGWKSFERRKQHPMYSTSSHEVGLRPPTLAALPTKWFGGSGTFSKEFMNANKFGESRRAFTTLHTSMTRNNVHHTLDQGWRGDSHSAMLFAPTGAKRKLGSEQRVY